MEPSSTSIDEKILDLMSKMNTNLQDVTSHLTKMSNRMYILNRNAINSNNKKNDALDLLKTTMLETKLLVAQMSIKIDDMHAERKSLDEKLKRREKDALLFKEGIKDEIDEIKLELEELRKTQHRESKRNHNALTNGK